MKYLEQVLVLHSNTTIVSINRNNVLVFYNVEENSNTTIVSINQIKIMNKQKKL